MNPDYIKWLVSYAEGFEWIDTFDGEHFNIGLPTDRIVYDYELDYSSEWEKELWPLLLQKAIEGINKVKSGWKITQNDHQVNAEFRSKFDRFNPIEAYSDIFVYNDYENEDQAKNQALEYVYKREIE